MFNFSVLMKMRLIHPSYLVYPAATMQNYPVLSTDKHLKLFQSAGSKLCCSSALFVTAN